MDNSFKSDYILWFMTWNTFLRIVEIRTKIVSVSTFTLAVLSALWLWGSVPWHSAVLLFIAVLAVDMGTTAFNTFFDYEKGVDAKTTNREEDKVLVHKKVAPGYALVTALGLFAFAAVLGIFLVLWTGWPLLILGVASLAVAFLYSGGPRPISSTPWGELFAGLFLGTVLWVVVVYVLGAPQRWSADLWWRIPVLSLPSFLFIASILTVNNCCDREGDAQAGRRTLAILWGPRANLLILIQPLAAYLALGVLSILGLVPWTFLIVAVAGPALTVPFWRGMFHRGFSHATKGPNMGAVSQTFLVYTLVSVAGWVSGIALR
jgi:1,4-dihydroxy-2-naphthoate octaprenyltransferase